MGAGAGPALLRMEEWNALMHKCSIDDFGMRL